MNVFKKIFLAIRTHCFHQKPFIQQNAFEIIAKESDISVPALTKYLNSLEEHGLIKYSLKDNYITFTHFGEQMSEVV